MGHRGALRVFHFSSTILDMGVVATFVKCTACDGHVVRVHRRWWQRALFVKWAGRCNACKRDVRFWVSPREASQPRTDTTNLTRAHS
jgi:hypothetical protein